MPGLSSSERRVLCAKRSRRAEKCASDDRSRTAREDRGATVGPRLLAVQSRSSRRLDRAASLIGVALGWARDEPLERPSSAAPRAILFPSPRTRWPRRHLDGFGPVAFVVEMLADQPGDQRALFEAFLGAVRVKARELRYVEHDRDLVLAIHVRIHLGASYRSSAHFWAIVRTRHHIREDPAADAPGGIELQGQPTYVRSSAGCSTRVRTANARIGSAEAPFGAASAPAAYAGATGWLRAGLAVVHRRSSRLTSGGRETSLPRRASALGVGERNPQVRRSLTSEPRARSSPGAHRTQRPNHSVSRSSVTS